MKAKTVVAVALLLLSVPVGLGAGGATGVPDGPAPHDSLQPQALWGEALTMAPEAGVQALERAHRVADRAAAGGTDGILSALAGGPFAVPLPGPQRTLGDLVVTLAIVHGGPIAEADRVGHQLATALGPAEKAALASLLQAHLHQVAVHRAHWEGPHPPTPEAFHAGLEAHASLAASGLALAAVSTCHPGLTGGVSGVLFFDLACEDTTHLDPVHLSIDAGGADTYLNNAGGNSLGGPAAGGGYLGVAAAFDLAGDDAYRGTGAADGAINGAAFVGLGFLLDAAGDDDYAPTVGDNGALNGGGHTGVGTMVDIDGNDTYHGTGRIKAVVNGAGRDGLGVLLDLGGDDAYDASIASLGAANGASDDGEGWLVDARGNDTYDATLSKDGAINGAAEFGLGHLVDLRGDDRYTGTVGGLGAVNGGAVDGIGVLLDLDGDDQYRGTVGEDGGVNGGAFAYGTAVLQDRTGDDVYWGSVARRGGVNGGSIGGVGLLRDGEGHDRYNGSVGTLGGVNGASTLGVGVLVDDDGDNRFSAHTPGESASNGATRGMATTLVDAGDRHLPGGLGLLVAGPGNDRYWSNGTGQGAGERYGTGLLVDLGGANRYIAGPDPNGTGAAQGYGRLGGTGILLDLGEQARFELRSGVTGQGTGSQGLGLLLRPDHQGASTYVAPAGALPSAISGAGLGIRIDQGITDLVGPPVTVQCARTMPVVPAATVSTGPLVLLDRDRGATLQVHLCPVEETDPEDLTDPRTGAPVGPVAKPPLDCTAAILSLACGVVEELLGPSAVQWLERADVTTTSRGGLSVLTLQTSQSQSTHTAMKKALPSADETCDAWCGLVPAWAL